MPLKFGDPRICYEDLLLRIAATKIIVQGQV